MKKWKYTRTNCAHELLELVPLSDRATLTNPILIGRLGPESVADGLQGYAHNTASTQEIRPMRPHPSPLTSRAHLATTTRTLLLLLLFSLTRPTPWPTDISRPPRYPPTNGIRKWPARVALKQMHHPSSPLPSPFPLVSHARRENVWDFLFFWFLEGF